jgi:hypothetical protein
MNGFAGLSQSRRRRRENNTLTVPARILSKENADLVVGPVALIAKLFPPIQVHGNVHGEHPNPEASAH